MEVAGRYFDGTSSRRRQARLCLEDGRFRVLGEEGVLQGPAALDGVEISSRIGNTPRFVRFPAGGAFETDDNDAIDALTGGRSRWNGLAHRLESRLRYVALGLVVTIAFVWGGVQWGVPAAARMAAFSLPADVNAHADRMVLELLDAQVLEPTRLSEAEQARLAAAFAPLVDEVGGGHSIRVLFRDAEDSIGPNALALPGGTIVFTDQIVRLAQHDAELAGVLAHEIGHVVHRHAMRRSIQASAMGLIAAVVVGDVSSVSSAITALPLILTELGYSRDFEREADAHARDTLIQHGLDPVHLAKMLQRLDDSDGEGGAYLSTHPPTPERARLLTGEPRVAH